MKEKNSSRTYYRPEQIESFGHTSSGAIFKYVIRQPWFNPVDSSGVYMEEIVSGPISLYQEIHGGREYYYAVTPERVHPLIGGRVDKDGKPTNQPEGTSRLTFRFRDQLKLILPNEAKLQRAIENADHNREDFVRLFTMVSNLGPEKSYTINAAAIKKKVEIYHKLLVVGSAGLNYTRHYYLSNGDQEQQEPFSTNPIYNAGVAYRITSEKPPNLMGELSAKYSHRPLRGKGVSGFPLGFFDSVYINPIHLINIQLTGYYRFSTLPLQPSIFLSVGQSRPLTDPTVYYYSGIPGLEASVYERNRVPYNQFSGGILFTLNPKQKTPIQIGAYAQRLRYGGVNGFSTFKESSFGVTSYIGIANF